MTRRKRSERSDGNRRVEPDGVAPPPRPTASSATYASDHELVLAMRRGESKAFVAFIARFEPLLRGYAARTALRSSLRWEIIGEVLDDVALRLVRPGSAIPGSVAAYVIVAFRYRFLEHLRTRERHARVVREAAADVLVDCTFEEGKEAIAACSAAQLGASHGPDHEVPEPSMAITRLALRLGDALTTEERRLLVAARENVPQREVASWLAVSHAAARKRLERLRVRLASAALQYVETLAPDERRELERFFRRCRARIPDIGSSAGTRRTGEDDHE